jgi:hypothetical protein
MGGGQNRLTHVARIVMHMAQKILLNRRAGGQLLCCSSNYLKLNNSCCHPRTVITITQINIYKVFSHEVLERAKPVI